MRRPCFPRNKRPPHREVSNEHGSGYTEPNGNPFDAPFEAPQKQGPSPEEQAFLKANPGHEWKPADPVFPNRPEGIYPTWPGNEWRPDPPAAQALIDLHFAKHTAQGAGYGALAAGSALAAPFAAPVITAVTNHLDKLKAIVDYAEKIGFARCIV